MSARFDSCDHKLAEGRFTSPCVEAAAAGKSYVMLAPAAITCADAASSVAA